MAESETTSKTAIEVPKRPPGTLCAMEVSYRPVLELSLDEQNALKSLCEKVQQRDMPARREEVIRVWEKRLFDRGFQHLVPTRGGGWVLPSLGSGYRSNDQDSRSIFETNIYSSYEDIIVSALTRKIPGTRFRPRRPDEDADITAAENATKVKGDVDRNSGMLSKMAEMARFLWTDGRAVFFTQYIKDGQRFGYEDPEEEEQEQETVPEDEEQISEEEKAEGDGEVSGLAPEISDGIEGNSGNEDDVPGAEAGDAETREPRGRECTVVLGALESKFPIKADRLNECGYGQVVREIDLQMARAKYPDVAEKITAQQGGPGGDDIDRLARINTRLGVLENYITTDSAAYDVTEQMTWFRPAQLLEIPQQELRDSLIKKAGENGLRVIFCGLTFCETRSISMDEQLTLVHARPGDGMHRPGLGDWLVPIQKVFNNWLELADDYFVRGVPAKWMDQDIFDLEKLRDQTNMVGAVHPFEREDGVQMSEAVWEETPVQFPAMLWEMIQDFKGETAQLLCGAFPALSGGGDSSPTDTMGGMMIQRDQALGRIGLPWRNIKEAMSCVAKQQIVCLARNHGKALDIMDGDEAERVEMAGLQGDFLTYPDTDENFPFSYTERQNRMGNLLTSATQDPLTMQILASPDNLEEIKNAIGLENLTLPMLEARNKQLGEWTLLIRGGPTPNPKVAQATQLLQQLQAKVAVTMQLTGQPDPQIVAQIQQVQQAIQSLPPQVSSIEIDEEYDDHATEFATVTKLVNAPKARKMKNGTEDEKAGIENGRLHGLEHKAALAKQQAGKPPTGKPPSVSLALKDMPPKVAAEAANAAGLPATQQDFEQQQLADAAEKHPGPGGIVQ